MDCPLWIEGQAERPRPINPPGGGGDISGDISRRSFLKGAVGTGLALAIPEGLAGCGSDSGFPSGGFQGRPPKVLFLSIDSLPPSYLTLNRRGERGGKTGDWLTPNVMRFLEGATLFADARGYLPAATDMNHLNAVAGTSSAQTGVISVSLQPCNWNVDGTMRIDLPIEGIPGPEQLIVCWAAGPVS